jgi:hypothetical protein
MKGKTVVVAGASRVIGAEHTVRGPAIVKQPGLLDIASFLESPDE